MHDVALGGLHAVPLDGLAEGQPGTHPLSEIHQRPLSQYPYLSAPHPLFHAHVAKPLQGEPSFGSVVGHVGGGGGHSEMLTRHLYVLVSQYAKSEVPHDFQ